MDYPLQLQQAVGSCCQVFGTAVPGAKLESRAERGFLKRNVEGAERSRKYRSK